MVSVVYRGQITPRIGIGLGKLAVLGSQGFNVKKIERSGVALFPELVPDLVKRYAFNFVTIISERVKIAFTLFGPVDKLDAELKGSAYRGQHVGLINADQFIETQKRRDGGFANANDANILGFNQRDIGQAFIRKLGKCRCRHPSSGPSSNDYYILNTHNHSLQ